MTDWFAVGATEACADAGLDLQMPGPDRFYGSRLAEAVEDGRVAEQVLDDVVRRWLTLVDRLGAWDDVPAPERAVDLPAHREVAHRAAAAATVLLRNDGVLPLTGGGTVALVGPLAGRAHVMGGGSAQLRPHRSPSLLDVLRPVYGERLTHERGCDIDKTVRPLRAGGTVELFASDDRTGPVAATEDRDDLRLLWFGAPADGLDENAFSFRAAATLQVEDTGRHLFTLVQSGRARVLVDGVVVLDGVTCGRRAARGCSVWGASSCRPRSTWSPAPRPRSSWSTRPSGSMVLHGVHVGHRPPAPEDPLGAAVAAAEAADVAVVVVGTSDEWESEGHDRTSMHLPGDQDELVRRVCAANPRTVVVVCAGAPVAMPWADDAAAVLLPWLGGQEASYALDDVLHGRAEPGGRLPVTLPLRLEHAPAHPTWPGANDETDYAEGLLVGYRWYTTRHLPVRFPFGHGGSYTSFAWGPARLSAGEVGPGERVTVTLEVTNTGDRRGSDVVQVYVDNGPSRLPRPRRELRGHAKVALAPGETRLVEVELAERSFATWDPGAPDSPCGARARRRRGSRPGRAGTGAADREGLVRRGRTRHRRRRALLRGRRAGAAARGAGLARQVVHRVVADGPQVLHGVRPER